MSNLFSVGQKVRCNFDGIFYKGTVKETKITRSFLNKHKNDTVYTYCQGIRIKRNGDGVGKCGGYIRFAKGKIGKKYTLLLRYRKGATEVDDIIDRIDYAGWNKPFSR